MEIKTNNLLKRKDKPKYQSNSTWGVLTSQLRTSVAGPRRGRRVSDERIEFESVKSIGMRHAYQPSSLKSCLLRKKGYDQIYKCEGVCTLKDVYFSSLLALFKSWRTKIRKMVITAAKELLDRSVSCDREAIEGYLESASEMLAKFNSNMAVIKEAQGRAKFIQIIGQFQAIQQLIDLVRGITQVVLQFDSSCQEAIAIHAMNTTQIETKRIESKQIESILRNLEAQCGLALSQVLSRCGGCKDFMTSLELEYKTKLKISEILRQAVEQAGRKKKLQKLHQKMSLYIQGQNTSDPLTSGHLSSVLTLLRDSHGFVDKLVSEDKSQQKGWLEGPCCSVRSLVEQVIQRGRGRVESIVEEWRDAPVMQLEGKIRNIKQQVTKLLELLGLICHESSCWLAKLNNNAPHITQIASHLRMLTLQLPPTLANVQASLYAITRGIPLLQILTHLQSIQQTKDSLCLLLYQLSAAMAQSLNVESFVLHSGQSVQSRLIIELQELVLEVKGMNQPPELKNHWGSIIGAMSPLQMVFEYGLAYKWLTTRLTRQIEGRIGKLDRVREVTCHPFIALYAGDTAKEMKTVDQSLRRLKAECVQGVNLKVCDAQGGSQWWDRAATLLNQTVIVKVYKLEQIAKFLLSGDPSTQIQHSISFFMASGLWQAQGTIGCLAKNIHQQCLQYINLKETISHLNIEEMGVWLQQRLQWEYSKLVQQEYRQQSAGMLVDYLARLKSVDEPDLIKKYWRNMDIETDITLLSCLQAQQDRQAILQTIGEYLCMHGRKCTRIVTRHHQIIHLVVGDGIEWVKKQANIPREEEISNVSVMPDKVVLQGISTVPEWVEAKKCLKRGSLIKDNLDLTLLIGVFEGREQETVQHIQRLLTGCSESHLKRKLGVKQDCVEEEQLRNYALALKPNWNAFCHYFGIKAETLYLNGHNSICRYTKGPTFCDVVNLNHPLAFSFTSLSIISNIPTWIIPIPQLNQRIAAAKVVIAAHNTILRELTQLSKGAMNSMFVDKMTQAYQARCAMPVLQQISESQINRLQVMSNNMNALHSRCPETYLLTTNQYALAISDSPLNKQNVKALLGIDSSDSQWIISEGHRITLKQDILLQSVNRNLPNSLSFEVIANYLEGKSINQELTILCEEREKALSKHKQTLQLLHMLGQQVRCLDQELSLLGLLGERKNRSMQQSNAFMCLDKGDCSGSNIRKMNILSPDCNLLREIKRSAEAAHVEHVDIMMRQTLIGLAASNSTQSICRALLIHPDHAAQLNTYILRRTDHQVVVDVLNVNFEGILPLDILKIHPQICQKALEKYILEVTGSTVNTHAFNTLIPSLKVQVNENKPDIHMKLYCDSNLQQATVLKSQEYRYLSNFIPLSLSTHIATILQKAIQASANLQHEKETYIGHPQKQQEMTDSMKLNQKHQQEERKQQEERRQQEERKQQEERRQQEERKQQEERRQQEERKQQEERRQLEERDKKNEKRIKEAMVSGRELKSLLKEDGLDSQTQFLEMSFLYSEGQCGQDYNPPSSSPNGLAAPNNSLLRTRFYWKNQDTNQPHRNRSCPSRPH